jgi:tetratricopeptide (TPR) repeat protein
MSISSNIKSLINKPSGYLYFPFKNAFQPYLVLIAISIAIYINTFNHEVAYDDETILHRNEFVIKGAKGISALLTHDSYFSYYKQMGLDNSLPGGRYRPLSHITFAIEQEFIGTIPSGIIDDYSWDTNRNGIQDPKEDTNKDGLFTDYDFWVKGSGFRHIINVLLYALLIGLMYHVLITHLFSTKKDMVFLSLLLFAVHPLHTEVVANIKSRDEILSLIFIFSTLGFALRYSQTFKRRDLILTMLNMLLALLSKEYALVLFGLIPAVLFIFYKEQINIKEKGFWILLFFVAIASFSLIKFFNSGTLIAVPILFLYGGYYFAKKSTFVSTRLIYGLGAALVLYLAMRFAATTHQVEIQSFENDIIGNPYLLAAPNEIWATKIYIWLKYIILFFVPTPLLADYSYKTIPYLNFTSPMVWLSITVYSILVILTIWSIVKRKYWAFGLMFFIGFFIPVANVFINIGATMGERLFFHASLGLCIFIAMIVFNLIERLNWSKKPILLTLFVITLIQTGAFAILTVKRNPDWKNNQTLFIKDVTKAPENINTILGAATSFYEIGTLPKNKKMKYFYAVKANYLYNQGIATYSKHFPLYNNKAINFYSIDMLDSALVSSNKAFELSPTQTNVLNFRFKLSNHFMYLGVQQFEKKNFKIGMEYLVKSLSADKANDKAWTNMGFALLQAGARDKALTCFKSALQFNPQNQKAIQAIKDIQAGV